VSIQAIKSADHIIGYEIKERIGAGGYGEVWRAEAPGGLSKAVKFVYGYLDEHRATRELKALGRVKEVRHPFLLSLERIEIVEGQLVIVTELADESLKDCYERHQQNGLPGIPRKDLLDYLRDAADALDHMSEKYSLQHLDVKPENMLLLAGRVKVADFGLVKDIHDVTGSMMGGLTPVYASPEVFDGRASLQSDQYSLAILYQEMLTGVLPFPGRTAAQLATQHLNSRPRLSSLPADDQPAVARALEKDPKKRFPNCRALIDSLLGARPVSSGLSPALPDTIDLPTSPEDTTTIAGQDTQSVVPPRAQTGAGVERPDCTVAMTHPGQPRQSVRLTGAPKAEARQAESLPPIRLDAGEVAYRPTLFVGIGGAASTALRHLRRRLVHRFGDLESIPAQRLLLLDTDVLALSDATRGGDESALNPADTLSLPLRHTSDYRADSGDLLNWLSRRWLYNIPRSLQTQGLRPLGRLALVDHAGELADRLKSLIGELNDPETVDVTGQRTGLQFQGSPQVVVVASISGGTGSGMVLDVAYQIRQVLRELNLPDDAVRGVLTHATGRNPNANDLAIASAYACLSELGHFAESGFTDDASDASASDGHRLAGPFRDTYVVHLGENLDESQMYAALDRLAGYLYLDAVTPGGALLAKAREAAVDRSEHSDEKHDAPLQVRSFSLGEVSCIDDQLISRAAELLGRNLVQRWTDVRDQAGIDDGKEVDRQAKLRASILHLNLESLLEQMLKMIQRVSAAAIDPDSIRTLDACAACYESGSGRGPSDEDLVAVGKRLLDQHQQLADRHAADVGRWVLQLLGTTSTSIGRAKHGAYWFIEYLRKLEHEAGQLIGNLQERMSAFREQRSDAPPVEMTISAGMARVTMSRSQFAEMRRYEIAMRGVKRLINLIREQVSVLANRISQLDAELGQLGKQFRVDFTWEDLAQARHTDEEAGDRPDDLRRAVAQHLRVRVPELAAELNQQFYAKFFGDESRLRDLISSGQTSHDDVLTTLRQAARTAVLAALREINVAQWIAGPHVALPSGAERLGNCHRQATTPLAQCGGAKRLIAMFPPETDKESFEAALADFTDDELSLVAGPEGDFMLLYEHESLALADVARKIIDDRLDYAQAAARLHTRTDVQWQPLTDLDG